MCLSLQQLVQDDYELLNDIIIEYVDMIDDNKYDELEQYVNNNLNEILH